MARPHHWTGYSQADPAKIDAIVGIPFPAGPDDLIRLLGMVNYLDEFCLNLAALTRPIRDLLKRDAAWVWETPQKAALVKLKAAL